MRVDLLGTGSADRWPNPWCTCPSCTVARDTGTLRARTSALVDRRVLIDPGPDIGSRGEDLSAVRTVLITHDHPDHLDPAFLLAWSWAGGPGLTVAGPHEAIERCRDWVTEDAPVRFRALSAGDELTSGTGEGEALRVRALPAAHSTAGVHDDGTALLYLIAGPGATVLYATDTRSLPVDHLTGPIDLVLLELTFGEHTTHGTAHLDLPTFDHAVRQLRTRGLLTPQGRVVAVHLSHHNPPDLDQRLAAVGAEVLPDGSTLWIGHDNDGSHLGTPTSRRLGRSILITGGARSGKSARAEALARSRPAVTYVATAPRHPDDDEWLARIRRHQDRRPADWDVVETADIPGVLRAAGEQRTVLVDCLTLWLTTVVDGAEAWADSTKAHTALDHATDDLLDALAATRCHVITVTNEVGSGIVPGTATGRLFRDLLGRLNARVAAACDDVEVVTVGLPTTVKGRPWPTSN